MNKIQYRLIVICSLFLFTACRGYQEKSKAESTWHNTLDTRDYLHYGFLKQDTNRYTRLWFYQTDSSFRFQTDNGLVGKAGLLQIYEYGQQNSSMHTFLDSVTMHTQKTAESRLEQNQKGKSYNTYFIRWFIIIILLGIAVGLWLFRSLFRHRR